MNRALLLVKIEETKEQLRNYEDQLARFKTSCFECNELSQGIIGLRKEICEKHGFCKKG